MKLFTKKIKSIYQWMILLFLPFFLIELCLYFVTQYIELPINYPTYSISNVQPFWRDININFGVWHTANDSFVHKKSCFDVEYTSNSYGARDKERKMKAGDSKKRIVVLGDSFIEGFGVERTKRLSDLLEVKTGLEHLNFGTSGNFGTIQQAILYETLAINFDHDFVVIGMLPYNDFFDDSLEFGKKVYKNRYRPYYEGSYPNYKITYLVSDFNKKPYKNTIKSYLRNFTLSYNIISYCISLFVYRDNSNEKLKQNYSGYYDYSSEDLLRVRYSYERIVNLANKSGKRVLLFTIPVFSDFIRYKKNKKPAPLNIALSKMSDEIGFEYFDLLPSMKKKGEIYRFFHSCDGHWNNFGHQLASEILFSKTHLYQNIKK